MSVCFSWSAAAHARTWQVPGDHATIQAAIDAAAPGDVVLVAAGEYREQVRLAAGVTLRSAGDERRGEVGLLRAEKTILEGTADAEQPGVQMAEGAVLDGFTVRNTGRYDDAAWQKHFDTHGNEQKHEHIGHFGTPGVGIDGVTCVVTNCIVHHNGSTGIAIRGGEGKACAPRITRNVCYRNMGGGIGSMAGSTAWIEGNRCYENFYAGIGHDGASPMVVDNECYGNVRAGIGISEGACPVVRGNKCYHNRRAGIGVRTGEKTSPVVENNACYENDMAGIGVDEQATPILRGNRCYRNKLAGIGSQHGARPLIVRNECYENEAAGIGTRDGGRPTIVENHVHDNAKAGIGVSDESSAVLVGNRCLDNRLVAIGVPGGGSAVVVGNELRRRGGGAPPLVAAFKGAKLVVVDNDLQGGGVATLLLEADAHVAGNRFKSDAEGAGNAIWARPTAKLNLVGNRFESYASALRSAAEKLSAVGNEVLQFRDTAIHVDAPEGALVVGNRGRSKNPQAKITAGKAEKIVDVENALQTEAPK